MALRHLNDAGRNLADAAHANSDAEVIRAAQIWEDAVKQAHDAKTSYMSHLESQFERWLEQS